MIRVNLIQPVGMPAQTVATVALPASARKQGAAFVASAIICAAIVGSLYWVWSHQIAQSTRQLALEREEAAKLAGIQAENEKFRAELMAIQAHIVIIQDLNKAREGPMNLMTGLATTVNRASGLYLTSVANAGGQLKITGQSQYVDSIADFITALNQAGPFNNVQLQRLFEDDQKDHVNFSFELTCGYTPPSAKAPAGAAVPIARPALR